MAQAALLGMHTTGFPVSPLTPATFLVVGLSDITLAQHQRFTMPYLFGASVVMTIAAIVFRRYSALIARRGNVTQSELAAARATREIRIDPAIELARMAISTTWSSSAWPSAPLRWRKRPSG